jgi:hypothetical protein
MAVSAFLLTHLAAETPLVVLMLDYAVFGIGFGLVNAPITNTAVSGMPKAQAGLAAAVASTSRQVGASIGVAVAGTVVGMRAAGAIDFTGATHAVWWIVVGNGFAIALLGLVANSRWACASTSTVAQLLDDQTAVTAGAPLPRLRP